MLARVATTALLCLALPQDLLADRFYFGSAEAAAKMTEGTADSVEGVLLREENGNYVIRVENGEITVPKSMVYKIEKDALTVAQLEQREGAKARQLAEANVRRQQIQATEATARREAREATVAATSDAGGGREMRVVIDFQGLLPNYVFRTFDPVLNKANIGELQQIIEDFLRIEVEKAANRR